MSIINILNDINKELTSLKPSTTLSNPDKSFVPSFKVEDLKKKYKLRLFDHVINKLQNIKTQQDKYNEKYQENLYKRKEYVTNSLNKMKNQLESKETSQLKNLKSKIDFIKSQNLPKLQKIRINPDNSLKIYTFLSKIPLDNEFEWVEDFLKRKVIFEVESPSELEVINLRKMVNLLQNNK